MPDREVVLVVSGQQSYILSWHGRPTAHAGIPTTTRTRVEACDADRLYSFGTLNLKNQQRLMQPELEQTQREPAIARERQITTPRIEHFISGRGFAGSSKREMDVFNPATGEVTARVAMASSADVEVAVAAARAAFYEWSAISAIKRARAFSSSRNYSTNITTSWRR